jgi:L-threonylcarbamoyladenylate synthase
VFPLKISSYPPLESEIDHAARLVCAGELVAFPTETVYGLGADASNSVAVRAIYAAKGRPANNPLIVHVASFDQLLTLTNFHSTKAPQLLLKRLSALNVLWPGPLSVVVPRTHEIAGAVSAGGDTVGLRIPAHDVALELIKKSGRAIAAPSANPSMYISPTTAKHVLDNLSDRVSYVLDGGASRIGIESTVVSLLESSAVQILRPGAITVDDLERALGERVEPAKPKHSLEVGLNMASSGAQGLLSPGLLAKHYSPYTPVRLLNEVTDVRGLADLKIGAIVFSKETILPFKAANLLVLSDKGDLNDVAANLFAALREMDRLDLELIVVEACEPRGLGAAIMDRLLRARG